MILVPPNSVAVEIFGFALYWYGIILAVAIFIGTLVADWVYRKNFLINNDKDMIINIIPWLIFVGLAGARVYYCILNWHYYFVHPLMILNVREGGLSIHGALLACLIFLVFYLKKMKVKFFVVSAPLVIGLPLAQSIGRWGNFFNSEAFGKPIENGFIKLFVPENLRPLEFRECDFFHPTFFYESILDLIIFFVLLWMLKKGKSPLFITLLYFVLYSIVRIIVESMRIDSVVNIFGIPVAIVVSFLILVFAILGTRYLI